MCSTSCWPAPIYCSAEGRGWASLPLILTLVTPTSRIWKSWIKTPRLCAEKVLLFFFFPFWFSRLRLQECSWISFFQLFSQTESWAFFISMEPDMFTLSYDWQIFRKQRLWDDRNHWNHQHCIYYYYCCWYYYYYHSKI